MFLKTSEVRYIIIGLILTVCCVLVSLGYLWALNILWIFAIFISLSIYIRVLQDIETPNNADHNNILALFLCAFMGITAYLTYQNEYPFFAGIISFTTACAVSRNLKGLLS